MALPPPQELLDGLTAAERRRIGTTCWVVWVGLLAGYATFDEDVVEYRCSSCAQLHTATKSEALNRLLMVVGTTWSAASLSLVATETPEIPGAHEGALQEAENAKGVDDTPVEWSRLLLLQFSHLLGASHLLWLHRRGHLPHPALSDPLESAVTDVALGIFHEYFANTSIDGVCKHGPDAAFLLRRLMGDAFHLLATVFNVPARPWSEAHPTGPFSQLRVAELRLLAERASAVQTRYGQKQVEKVFEQQLALLVQSFGFYVVPARIGDATADLVCMSADSSAQFTFLLDAKSSGRPYALPMDDRRALADYVTDARSNLATAAAPVEFLLIVGGNPGSTLHEKLRDLEQALGLPVRFCPAHILASLREALVGPLPLAKWKEAVLRSPHILGPTAFVAVLDSVAAREAAKANVIRTFLDL